MDAKWTLFIDLDGTLNEVKKVDGEDKSVVIQEAVNEVRTALKNNAHVVIVSSRPREAIVPFLKEAKLPENIESIQSLEPSAVFNDMDLMEKAADLEGIEDAARALKKAIPLNEYLQAHPEIKREHAIIVGNDVEDKEAAHVLGMRFAPTKGKLHTEHFMSHSHFVAWKRKEPHTLHERRIL